MSLLRATTVFIGWLSGSLAGIGALLYACGYLVTRAHLHLLGIDGFLTSSNERFIQQGANFVAITGELLIAKVLGLLQIFLVLAIVPVLVYVLVSRRRRRRGGRLGTGWSAAKARAVALHARLPWSTDVSVYLVLLALLFFYVLAYRRDFFPPLRVADLLYADVSPTGSEIQDRIRCWLLTANTARLRTHYSALVDAHLIALGLLVVAWRVTALRGRPLVMVAPFLAVFALYTVYLPMLYGVLVHSTTYNVVTVVNRAERGPGESESRLFLLQKTSNEFVVWDAAEKTVLWLPADAVAHARVGRGTTLFSQQGVCRD